MQQATRNKLKDYMKLIYTAKQTLKCQEKDTLHRSETINFKLQDGAITLSHRLW